MDHVKYYTNLELDYTDIKLNSMVFFNHTYISNEVKHSMTKQSYPENTKKKIAREPSLLCQPGTGRVHFYMIRKIPAR